MYNNIIISEIACHINETECSGTEFPVTSIGSCCNTLQGRSIHFSAAGGTCQPCISELKYNYVVYIHSN